MLLEINIHYSNTPLLHCLPLRHKHGEAFAGAACFDEFAHRQLVAIVAAVFQLGHELRRAFRQNDIAFNDYSVTRKVRRLVRNDIYQIGHVLPDCALAVFIEGIRKPKPTAVG